MSLNKRLAVLSKNIELLYEKLGAMEKSLAMAVDPEIKISIQQRIREEIKPEIQKNQSEYLQLLATQANSIIINENDANDLVVEMIEAIEIRQNNNYPDQVINLLTEIRNELNKPEKSSSAKLKATIPLLPPFLSYEVDFETEDVLRRLFPTFDKLIKKKRK